MYLNMIYIFQENKLNTNQILVLNYIYNVVIIINKENIDYSKIYRMKRIYNIIYIFIFRIPLKILMSNFSFSRYYQVPQLCLMHLLLSK